jgi:hypothetical protein
MELIKGSNIKWKCTPTPVGLHEQTFNMCFNRIKPKSTVYAWGFNCNYYCASSHRLGLLCQIVPKTEPVFHCLWYGKPQGDGQFPKLSEVYYIKYSPKSFKV